MNVTFLRCLICSPKNSPPKVQRLVNSNINYKYIYITIIIYNPSSVPLSRKWRDWNPHGTQNNPNRCLQRETHHTLRKHTEKSNYWRDWNSHGIQNNLNRCLQRETHHTSRKRTGHIKLLERLEPTRNPKQPESMLAQGNTSHIKKTHWKNQTT